MAKTGTINGAGLSGVIFTAVQKSYIILDGFNIINSENGQGGIYIMGNASDIILRNLVIHDTSGSGIWVSYSHELFPAGKFNNVLIENCELKN